MRSRHAFALGLLAMSVVECASPSPDRTRFLNQPPVTKVNDRIPARRPEVIRDLVMLENWDAAFHDPVTRATEVRGRVEARGVNAMDQVPDSTWFTNRIGVRSLTPDEIRTGPLGGHDPESARPWHVVGLKASGRDPGLLVEDGRGTRYVLKFDPIGHPGLSTSAHIVVNRLLWALGYNVPEDEIVVLRREDLAIGKTATVGKALGGKRALRPADVDRVLRRIEVDRDGNIRAVASAFVPGTAVGGAPAEGVREDDPNDLIPHQYRRELRGLQPIFSWLKYTDVKSSNTLDTWVEDPATPGRGHVVHYLIDFGEALGVFAWVSRYRGSGYSRIVDFEEAGQSLVSFGLWRHSWEDIDDADYHGLGLYEIDGYQPEKYASNTSYPPFHAMTPRDGLWAASLIARFTPEQLRAAVDAAEIGDRNVEDDLVRALRARQRETARYWFSQINPLDRFAVVRRDSGDWLCFDDLLLSNRLGKAATRYDAIAYDHDWRRTGWSMSVRPDAAGHACVADIRPGRSHGGYTIIAIDTQRASRSYRPVYVHLAVDPDTGVLRPIGIRRP